MTPTETYSGALGGYDQRTDVCSSLCDATPTIPFTDELGFEIHWCHDCYHKPCGHCGAQITDDRNKRKGLCQECRDSISQWTPPFDQDSDAFEDQHSDTQQPLAGD